MPGKWSYYDFCGRDINLNLALPPPQSIPSFLPQKDFLDSDNSLKDVFSEAGPAAPAAEPLQVILQVRVPGREASVGGGRGRHGMSKDST